MNAHMVLCFHILTPPLTVLLQSPEAGLMPFALSSLNGMIALIKYG